MNKYWRLLAATTFLSAPAGLSAQAAGNDAPTAPRADREAGVLLAQAQGQPQIQGQPPIPEDQRKKNQNQQDNRKKQDDQNKAAEQQRKQQEDQAKRQADEQRKAAEQQRKQQDDQTKRQAQDDKRKQEDQRKATEQQQKQQAQDDKRKQDDQRKAAEQQQKQQAQDDKRKQEEQKKAAEQDRKASEQQQKQQAQDDKRKLEDQRKATEQQQKQQAQDDKRKQEEQKKSAEQQRKDEQERRKQEDKQRAEDEKNRRATGQPGTSAPTVTSAGTTKPDQKEAKPIEATGGKGSGIKPQSAEGKEVKNLDELKKERREIKQGNRTILQELDRAIIKEGNRTIIRHDETDRFRYGAREVRRERRGDTYVTIIVRPRGERIVNVVDENGFLIRRSRILPDGREIIIIDNRPRAGVRIGNFFIVVPPPRIRIPRDRYIVELERAEPTLIYETLMAPPVDVVSRPYTLDEIRYNAPVRDRMPRIDLNTVTFESGSWDLTPEQVDKLAVIADGIKRALERNPQEVFMIEGYTDAVGDEDDNLSLSDRRAESVALALTQQFEVPPENLTTQGYGEQNLKVPTDGPERANRRVTVRRITPLLMGQAQ